MITTMRPMYSGRTMELLNWEIRICYVIELPILPTCYLMGGL